MLDEELDQHRNKFENEAYKRYFFSSVSVENMSPRSDVMDKENFTKRNEAGNYVIKTLDSAWWGYMTAVKCFQTKVV